MKTLSRRTRLAAAEISALTAFFTARAEQARAGQADDVDLTFGDPHEMPLPGLVAALEAHLRPLQRRLVRLQGQRGTGPRGRWPRRCARSWSWRSSRRTWR